MAGKPPRSPLAEKIEFFEPSKIPVRTRPVKRSLSAPGSPSLEDKATKKIDTKTTPDKTERSRSSSRQDRQSRQKSQTKITGYYTNMSQSLLHPSAGTASAPNPGTPPSIPVVETQLEIPGQPNLIPLSDQQSQDTINAFNAGLQQWTSVTSEQVVTPSELDTEKINTLSTAPPTMTSLQALMAECCRGLIQVNSGIGKLAEQTRTGNAALGSMIKSLSIRADSADAKIKNVEKTVHDLETSRNTDTLTFANFEKRLAMLEKKDKKLTELVLSQEKSIRITEFHQASYEIRIVGINFTNFRNPNRPNIAEIFDHIMYKVAPGDREYGRRVASTVIAGKIEEKTVRGKLMPKSAPIVMTFHCATDRDQTKKHIEGLHDPCLQVYDNIPTRLVSTFENFRIKANEYRDSSKKHAKVAYRRDKDLGFRLQLLTRDGPNGTFKPMLSEVFPLAEPEEVTNDQEMITA